MTGTRATTYVPDADDSPCVKGKRSPPGGNEHARFVSALIERNRDVLMSYLAGLLGDRSDAEDVFQETCLRLLDANDLERHMPRARAYAFRIASNLAYDRFRRRRTRRQSIAPVDVSDEQSPLPEIIIDLERALERVEETLLELAPRCRRVFLLRVSEGLSYALIAEKLGVSKRTVEREMKHAIDACQDRLKPHER
jgi:RNA polymerase sigma factor (sigma-70 family)